MGIFIEIPCMSLSLITFHLALFGVERIIISHNFIAGSWSADWRDREINQILSGGGVDGWEVEYRHSPSVYPQLASDIHNVIFVRTSKRRSRH